MKVLLKKLFIISFLFLLGITQYAHAQELNDSTQIKKGRLIGFSTFAGTAFVGGLTGLYYLWYKDYDQSGFHSINDMEAWLQVDKVGHAYSNYQMSRIAFLGFRWAGLDEKKSAFIGSGLSFAFFTSVEVFDGFSSNWGWSWGDVAANAAGTGLFLGQQLAWHEQRILFKYSYSPTEYPQYNPELLGNNLVEKMLKDYNAQTYWLSVNPQSFAGSHRIFPKWLNIAFGYGAKGMTGTYHNPSEIDGVAIPEYRRTRQFYLSLDIDLSKIKTRSEFLRLLLETANLIKIPMPALEYNAENGFVLHALYF